MSVCRGRGQCWRATRALLLLSAAGLFLLRVPLSSHLEADFPHHSPDRLAHFIADFTNHPKLHTHLSGSWQVVEDQSNLSWWRYVVSYECGARCDGRVRVEHTHTHTHTHRVLVTDERCFWPPLTWWAGICSESDTDTIIERRAGGAGGARLHETRLVHCSLAAFLADLCGSHDPEAQFRALKTGLASMSVA